MIVSAHNKPRNFAAINLIVGLPGLGAALANPTPSVQARSLPKSHFRSNSQVQAASLSFRAEDIKVPRSKSNEFRFFSAIAGTAKFAAVALLCAIVAMRRTA